MRDPILDLGDMICQTLTFCYESRHRRSLGKTAVAMGQTFEQIVAAALAQRISENFEVRHRDRLDIPSDERSAAE